MSSLPTELYEELGSVCRGDVIQRGMPGFQDYATIFNGNVKCLSKAVVCPLDAEDVSRVVVFCAKHGLTLSVKAGGYGTAGWAINGDVIIDLSRITEIDIEPPNSDGTFTSLRQLASAYSKGKSTASSFSSGNSSGSESSSSNGGKRRRSDDAALRRYDLASRAVHTFLQGVDDAQRNSSTLPDGDGPSPSVRRRLETDPNIRPQLYITPSSSNTRVPQQDSGSGSSNSSSAVSRSRSGESNDSMSSSNDSTAATTPSPHSGNNSGSSFGSHGHDSVRRPPRNANPFGYLDEKKTHPPPPSMTTMQSHFPPPSMLRLLGAHQNLPAHAEPVHPCAYVTFGAGARQKEIDTYTARNKLEGRYVGPGTDVGVPYHVPFAAHPVGSSIMLLGGFGFLSRMHGLSIDNLVEVEMVLADGRIVVVSENQYPDLWWAVRGAGPCLGVATRYKARAYPVPVVFAGNLIYRFNRATAPSLIKHFRDCVKGAPRELYANVLLTAGPPGKDSLVVVQMCYVGRKEEGQEYLSAISSWDGEQCLLNEVDEKSFLHQQDSVAQVLRGKAGRQWFIRSALISSLPDDIINQTVMQFADTPVGCTWLFELAGGAVADFEDTCVPKSQREAQFTIAALHQWEMNFDDPRCVESAEEWIAETLKPVHTGGAFPSFLGRHEAADRAKACFGNNWERLKEVKQMYDPTNVFRNTFWPLDASGECVDPRTHEPPTP